MGKTCIGTDAAVYQLISSPAIFKNENSVFNTAYSILSVKTEGDAAKTTLVYDVTRIRSVGEKILSEVIRRSPSEHDIRDFIAELL